MNNEETYEVVMKWPIASIAEFSRNRIQSRGKITGKEGEGVEGVFD